MLGPVELDHKTEEGRKGGQVLNGAEFNTGFRWAFPT